MKYVIVFLGMALSALGLSLESVYADFTALVGGTIVITQVIKTLPMVKNLIAVIVSWGTGAILTAAGYFGELGFLVYKELWQVILIAIGVSLAANGFYSVVKKILQSLKIIK